MLVCVLFAYLDCWSEIHKSLFVSDESRQPSLCAHSSLNKTVKWEKKPKKPQTQKRTSWQVPSEEVTVLFMGSIVAQFRAH